MTREEALEVCRRWQDAFERRDLDGLMALYDDDATVESPMAGSISGRDALTQIHPKLFAAFPDMVTDFDPPIIDGDRVAIVGDATGQQVGAFMGLAPSSKSFRFRIVFLLELRAGKIIRDRRVYDFTGLLVQLGVLKAKPSS
jgi:steroid delta-isomerase-like uncharacterized protein